MLISLKCLLQKRYGMEYIMRENGLNNQSKKSSNNIYVFTQKNSPQEVSPVLNAVDKYPVEGNVVTEQNNPNTIISEDIDKNLSLKDPEPLNTSNALFTI